MLRPLRPLYPLKPYFKKVASEISDILDQITSATLLQRLFNPLKENSFNFKDNNVLVDSSIETFSERDIQPARGYLFDGIDDYISFPHLIGTETIISYNGTTTPTISLGRIDFTSGNLWSLELSDGTLLKCDEASETTSYDSSGNGNHGTIINADLNSFHTTFTDGNGSDFQNTVGYSLNGDVFIPRDESIQSQDVLGNPLQYSGRVRYNAKLVQSNCLNFNGTDQYVDISGVLPNTDLTLNQGYTFFGWIQCNSNTEVNALISHRDSPARLMQLQIESNGKTAVKLRTSENILYALEGSTVGLNLVHVVGVFDFINDELRLYENGIFVDSLTINKTGTMQSAITGIGLITASNTVARSNFKSFGVGIANEPLDDAKALQVYQNNLENIDLACYFPMSEGFGKAIYSPYGNLDNAPIVNYSQDMWQTQDTLHNNFKNGNRRGKQLIPYSNEPNKWNFIKLPLSNITQGYPDPDGGNEAWLLIPDESFYPNPVINVKCYPYGGAKTVTGSVWLKSFNGNSFDMLLLFSRVPSGYQYQWARVTNEWQRFSISKTMDGRNLSGFWIGGFNKWIDGKDLLMYNAQVEISETPTDYEKSDKSYTYLTKVPLNANKTADVLGNQDNLVLPFNGLNGAETKIDRNPIGAKELINANVPLNDIISYKDDFNSTVAEDFKKQSNNIETDFLIYNSALNEADSVLLNDNGYLPTYFDGFAFNTYKNSQYIPIIFP